jgi:1-acyl-sn-glycerol-3-phosphate acyltransferase
VPADARGNAMAVRATVEYLLVAIVAGTLAALAGLGLVSEERQLCLVAGLAAVGTAVAWWVLIRPTLEVFMEWLLWPLYKIRGRGPGIAHFPAAGPVLVVANHAAYVDPFFLGKVVPREITPMMTSLFYDLPGLRFLMKYVVHAIRVQASTYRREAPELQEAIAALDRGECVVIFPEGSLRRSDAKPLRTFGQGVWHILHERPQTPVVACWIEGGWGSFFSYWHGPPARNKRLDLRRRIRVAVCEAQFLKPDILTELRTTRAYLRSLCLSARRYLGLPPLVEEGEDEADDEAEPAAEAGQH